MVFEEPARADKCSRCGSPLGEDFAFCQVCGLAVGLRHARPQTQRLKVVTTAVRELRKRGTGEHAAQSGEFPIGQAGDSGVAKRPRRGPRRGGRALAGARGGAPPTSEARSEPPSQAPQAPQPQPPESEPEAWNLPGATSASASVSPAAPPDPLADLGASPLRLVLVNRDGSDGQGYFLPGERLTIGRTRGDLCFEGDEFLSPQHARLELREGGIFIVDLQSTNGIFVRIDGSVPVFPGDTFLLGHQLLRLDNVPDPPRDEFDGDGVRIFGTPLDPAWACLTRVGYGGVNAETYFLRAAVVVFGREQGDILYRDDAFISRQHAQLAVTVKGTAMAVSLTDLDSANGTYLRVRGEAKVAVGDMFRIGDQIFRVRKD
jgi:pSer/pThr/pTyr-binding forkhead associated (FHA) protein